jgi:heme ABC exporter ATP-binding subunit CcmA
MNTHPPTRVGTRFIASGDSSTTTPATTTPATTTPATTTPATTTPATTTPSITPPTIIPLVQITNLKKNFTLKPILRGVTLEIRQGQRVALLGANGTGKTTLLRILAGLTQPGKGTVSICGLDSTRDAQQIRRLVGFVAHQPYLYEELTALENLLFFARMYTVEHGAERARIVLQRVGLERRAQERVGTFSRGMLQRLAWARALLHSPQVLLLDEPDTGMDQQGHELIDTLLAEHTAQGGCTLFTTHQLERALSVSDHIIILAAGRIVFQRATAALDLETLQRIYQEATR